MNSEIQKKVSIIIPYYNSPLHLLNKCVQTAASQTYENCEVIVIVDGSTHNYRLVSALFENRQPKVRFVYKENGGVSSARNLGIKLSTGDFLVFIDSDDYIEEDYIEKMVAQSDNVDVVICGVTEQFFPTVEAKLIRKTFCSQPLRFCCLQYSNFSVNKLYRSDIIKEHDIQFDENIKLGEDALFNVRYMQFCEKFCSIADNLYHYVPNPNSAVKTFNPTYWEWERVVIQQWWGFFHQYSLSCEQEMYMTCWLLEKLFGTINYYAFNRSLTKKEKMRFLRTIENDAVYQPLEYRKMCLSLMDAIFGICTILRTA